MHLISWAIIIQVFGLIISFIGLYWLGRMVNQAIKETNGKTPSSEITVHRHIDERKILGIIFVVLFGFYMIFNRVSIDELIQPYQDFGQAIFYGITDPF